MAKTRRWLIRILLPVFIGIACTERSAAEWYVAGQVGVNFADRLTNIQGTGNLQSFSSPDFDLKNAVVYGGKLGYFPNHGAFGIELDAFNSTPHIKNLDDVPGIHMRVTNVGFNMLLRYPGQTFQPYVGVGGGALIAHIDSSPGNGNVSDSDVGPAFNVLTGIRSSCHVRQCLLSINIHRGHSSSTEHFPRPVDSAEIIGRSILSWDCRIIFKQE
jgi:hypothetical protein